MFAALIQTNEISRNLVRSRYTANRSMPPSVHRLIVGPTGTGKTNYMTHEMLQIVDRGDCWLTAVFPHPQAGIRFIAELYARYGKAILARLIVERLRDMDRVIMRQYVASSKETGFARLLENDEFAWNFLDMAARRRGLTDLAETPVLEKYAKLAVNAYQELDYWIPENQIPYILRFKHPAHRHAKTHCMLDELLFELERIGMFGVKEQISMLEPPERMLAALLRNATILARTSKPATFDFVTFKNNGGIHVILGGGVSEDALRVHVGSDFQQTMFHAKKEELREGYYSVDEGNNYRLIGNVESKALSTTRAFGMHIWYAVQSFDFVTEEIKNNVLTNTTHVWFRQTWELAREAAESLLPLLDEYKVHHVRTITRQIHKGFDEVKRITKSVSKQKDGKETEGRSETASLVPIYGEVVEDVPQYQSPSDQLVWLARRIQQLPIGQCIVNEHNRAPYLYRVPLMPDSWAFPGLAEAKAEECIQLIKSQMMYETPIHNRLTTPLPVSGMRKQTRSSGSSEPPPRNNSSKQGSSERTNGHAGD